MFSKKKSEFWGETNTFLPKGLKNKQTEKYWQQDGKQNGKALEKYRQLQTKYLGDGC